MHFMSLSQSLYNGFKALSPEYHICFSFTCEFVPVTIHGSVFFVHVLTCILTFLVFFHQVIPLCPKCPRDGSCFAIMKPGNSF